MCDLINLEEELVSVKKKLQAPLIPAPLISKDEKMREHLDNPFDSVLYAITEYEKNKNDPFEVVLSQASQAKNFKLETEPYQIPMTTCMSIAKPSEKLIDVDGFVSTNELADLILQEAGKLSQMFEELAKPETVTYDLLKDDVDWMTELVPLSEDDEEPVMQNKEQTTTKLLLELENSIEEENNPQARELLAVLGKALGIESTKSIEDKTKDVEKRAIRLVVDFVKVLNGQTDKPEATNVLKKLDNALNLVKSVDKKQPPKKISSARRSLSDLSSTKIRSSLHQPRRSVSVILSPAKRKDKIKRAESINSSLKLMKNNGICNNVTTMVRAGWEISDIKHENNTKGPMKAIIPVKNMLKKNDSIAPIGTPCRMKPMSLSTPSNLIRSSIPKSTISSRLSSNNKSSTTPLQERRNVPLKSIMVPKTRTRSWLKEDKENNR